jgi:putative ABC transport system substrate-binding protein
MRRRDFIHGIVGSAVAWSFAARAQQSKLPRIGILIPANPEPFWNEFQQGMRERDYIEGQTIQFEYRSAEGKPNLLRGLADELVRLKVDIIVASQTPAVTAAWQATTEIPIVMAPAGDPVGTGLISSLVQLGAAGRQHHRIVLDHRRTRSKDPRTHPRRAAVHAARGGPRQCSRSILKTFQ